MKRNILLVITLVTCSLCFAEERESLFKSEITSGGFGGPSIRFTELNGETNYLFGGQGAWLINHKYYLGGAGYGSTKKVKNTDKRLSYGGFLVGAKFNPLKTVHYSADILIGGGSLDKDDSNNNVSNDVLFVVEPGVNININLTNFAELNFSIKYRLIKDSDHAGLSDSDLSGMSIGANVMFGRF